MHRRIVLIAAAVALAGPAVRAEDKADQQARDAVAALVKALKAEDIDAAMKAVDVPWFHDKKELIKDKDELKQKIQGAFDKQDFSDLAFEVKEVHDYAKVREKLTEDQRAMVDEAAGKTARVVDGELEHNGEKRKTHFLVRIKDGKALVAGVAH